MLNIVIIVISFSVAGYLALSRRLARSKSWKAMVTPLASIMGSGFLISAPLLGNIVGNRAVFFMGILLVIAYMIGEAIRFNIKHFEPIEHKRRGAVQDLAFASRIILVGAYFISITYYLQLLAAFVLKMLQVDSMVVAKLITTSLLVLVGVIGIWRGLDKLESLEKYSISLNLGMIGALLASLVYYNIHEALQGAWKLPDINSVISFNDVRVLLGLLIVVQGFETSRYLGDDFSPEVRIKTMRDAQIISGIIYVLFVGLATILFQKDMGADVTAIITLIKPVAIVLPVLLSIAAIGSQFSASVADDAGAGGLMEDITNRRLPIKYAYLIILTVTLVLTWETNVNQIIAYASRAFALYYAFQCMVALIITRQVRSLKQRSLMTTMFAFLVTICLMVFAMGIPTG